MDRLQQAVWIYDIDKGRIIWANQSSLNIWQTDSLEELQSRELLVGMSSSVAKRLKQYQCDFIQDDCKQFREVWTLYPNGEAKSCDVVFSAIRLDDGRMATLCEVRIQQELDVDALRSAEALLHTSVMITLYDDDGAPLYRNPAARDNVRSPNESLHEHFTDHATMQLLIDNQDKEFNCVACVNTHAGSRWHDITALRCFDAASANKAWLISEVDVSRLKQAEEQAHFLAKHDHLTQLPNRSYVTTYFADRVRCMIDRSESGALIYIDLDKFKEINDTLGHSAGDELLIEMAERLKRVVSSEDSVARQGGDEFLVLVGPFTNPDTPTSLCERIIKCISTPMYLQDRYIQITPSIGISRFPEDGQSIDELMRQSDFAMYQAKDQGRNTYAYFSQSLSDKLVERVRFEKEVASAIEQGQMIAYFQPRVDVHSNQVLGAEALVRWIHPERGILGPDVFIPTCEATGLLEKLGLEVLEQAVVAQKAWSERGHDLKISVNLSPAQFDNPLMVEDFIKVLERYSVNPEFIELEITESLLLGNDDSTIKQLYTLVGHGFDIAIDDFGTGYSSLSYLHRYPIHCLKIDRSFIQSLESCQPIVELVISMAKLFDLNVVAEGVETREQLEVLKAIGCIEYQGYFFDKPLSFDAFSDRLQALQQDIS